MRVLSIIVNYRTATHAVAATESLVRALADIDGHIVVVDNDSRDGSYELLTKEVADRGWQERVEVIRAPRNGGFGYGNNLAIRRAYDSGSPPDFFFLMNPDAIAEPGAVSALADFLDDHPDVGIAGSRIYGPNGEPHTSAFRFPSPLGELEAGLKLGLATRALSRWVVAPGGRTSSGPADWVSGASFMVRRWVFEAIGLFDEDYFLYFEEIDLCARARRHGFTTYYVHESAVCHEGAIATRMSDTTRRVPPYWFASRRRFFRKNHGTATLVTANALFAMGHALWRVRRRIQRKPDRDPPRFLLDFLRHNLALGAAPASHRDATLSAT
jgi:GT2 family glycosyltransferase